MPQRILFLLFCLVVTLQKANLPFSSVFLRQFSPAEPSVGRQDLWGSGWHVPGWVPCLRHQGQVCKSWKHLATWISRFSPKSPLLPRDTSGDRGLLFLGQARATHLSLLLFLCFPKCWQRPGKPEALVFTLVYEQPSSHAPEGKYYFS